MAGTFKSKEKVLVHLLDNIEFYDRYTKPPSVTQAGISERTDLRQSTISYALNDLEESGLVEIKTSRVEGKKQRMKTYFLTDKGVKKAKDVRERMKESPVDIDMYGEERTVKAKNVNEYIPLDLDLLDIILKGEDGGIKFKVGDEEGSPVNHTKRLPIKTSFEDLEISQLEEWYKNGTKIGWLEGSSPFLLAEFTRRFEEDTNIFYFRVKSHKRPIDLWDSLSRFLEEIERVELSTYRGFTEQLDSKKSLEKLKKDLRYTSALLIFDGLEYDREMKDLILNITEEISDFQHIRVLLAVDETESDLDRPESALKIEVERTSSLYPDLIGTESKSEHEELDDLLFFQVEFEVSLALGYLSIFREPVKKDELLRLEAIDEEKLERLIESPLITRCAEDTVTVPKAVREKKKEMLSEDAKRGLHYLAAKYYKENDKVQARRILERLYHLLGCNDSEGATSVLKEEGSTIISRGYAEPLLDILSTYEGKHRIPEFIYYKAEAQRVSGSFEESREGYEKILEMTDDEGWQIRAYVGLGKVEEKLGRYGEAIYNLSQAEEIAKGASKTSPLKDQLGKIYARRGEIWNKVDDYDKARKDLERAIKNLVDEEDHHLLTSSYFILAEMEKSLEEVGDAIEPFRMGLKSWSRLDGAVESRVGRRRIGTLYKVLKELDDADIRLRNQYSSERTGPVQEEYEDLKAAALLSLAECYMEDGNHEKAIKTAENAKGTLLEEDKMQIAFTEALLGRAYFETGRNMEAQDHLAKSISLYRELGQSYELGLTYFSMAKVKEKNGDPEAAEKYYRKAVLSLSKSGAEQDAEKVKREIESIPISM